MAFLTKAANRGSIATGYDIDNSLKFEADNSEYMDRVITSQGNQKTWTYSGWVKRTEISFAGDGFGHTFFFGGAYGSESCLLRFNTGTTAATLDTLQIDIGFGGTLYRSHTSQRFRDTSAWYHIVLAVDTTQSTATDRFKLYVNGELVTSYYSRNNPAQNFDTGNNKAQSATYLNNVGSYKSAGTVYGRFCGYIAEVYNIDGSALAPTDFGEFDDDSGIWKPKKYTGSFPNNSWYLKFDDSGALGADSSGNGNNFTLNNITSADQALDTPTNNFCTLLSTSPSASYYKRVKDGGTSFQSVTNAWASCWSSIPLYSGKWYAEFKRTSAGTGGNIFVGAGGIDENLYYYNIFYVGGNGSGTTFSVGLYSLNGDFYSGSGVTGSSYAAGDIICVAVDQDNEAIYFRKNNGAWMGDGTNAGDPSSGASRTGAQIIDWGTATNLAISNYANGDETEANYGGYSCMSDSRTYTDDNGYGLFVYEPPTGYLAICSKNLAETG